MITITEEMKEWVAEQLYGTEKDYQQVEAEFLEKFAGSDLSWEERKRWIDAFNSVVDEYIL